MHNRKSVSTSSFTSSFTTKDTSSDLLPLYQTSNGSTNNNKNRRYTSDHNKLLNSISKNQLRNIYKSIIITITIIIFFRYVVRDLSSLLPSSSTIDSDNNDNHILIKNNKKDHKVKSTTQHQQHRIGSENNHDVELKENVVIEDNSNLLLWNSSNDSLLYNNNISSNHIIPNVELYPSLQYPFEHSSFIGLYFGSSWCPICKPITKLLDTTFRNIILKPPNSNNNETIIHNDNNNSNDTKLLLSIVYVSSDRTIDEMNTNIQPNWFHLPYNNDNNNQYNNERNTIKQLYKTCAKNEMQYLNITNRKYEIPTLIILSSITRQVLTYEGIQDIYDHDTNAINLWYELDKLNIALLDKY